MIIVACPPCSDTVCRAMLCSPGPGASRHAKRGAQVQSAGRHCRVRPNAAGGPGDHRMDARGCHRDVGLGPAGGWGAGWRTKPHRVNSCQLGCDGPVGAPGRGCGEGCHPSPRCRAGGAGSSIIVLMADGAVAEHMTWQRSRARPTSSHAAGKHLYRP